MNRFGLNGVLVASAWGALTVANCYLIPARVAPHVRIERLEKKAMNLEVRAPGNLNPKDSNTLKSEFEGAIEKKLFREGQRVKKGDLLVLLNRDKIQLDYQNKKDALDNAAADLAKSKREVRLQRALFSKQAVARSAVDDAERAVVKAEQALRSARENFHEMQNTWDSAEMRAPMDGTVTKDWVQQDKTVAAGKEVVTVSDVSEFTVRARIDELDIRSVHEGQSADVRLAVFGGAELRAEVSEIGTAPESSGLLAVPVTLRILDAKGLALRPKLTADITIHTERTGPILSVPAEAVANADGNTRVWTLDRLSRLRARSVTLGRTLPNRVEITQGLSPGEGVVTESEPEFVDGMRVFEAKETSGRSKTNAILQKLPKSDERPNRPHRDL